MKKIILQGAGFTDNFGDVLFYDIFLKESIKQNVDVDLINISDSVKRHLPYDKENDESFIKRIKKADGIVFIGGGYLGEPPNLGKYRKFKWGLRTIKYILYIAPFGMTFRKKIIVIGAGAGPISNFLTKRLIKWMTNYSELTIVRDHESYSFLVNLGTSKEKIIESVDTAILINKYYNLKANNNMQEKSIIVHLSESPDCSNVSKMILDDVDKFLKENQEYKLKAITDHNAGEQNKAIDTLKKMYKGKIDTHIYRNPEELINYINNSSVIITNKLHIAIVATALGKSVISVPKHTKVLRYFNQINESKRCIPQWLLKKGDVLSLLKNYHGISIKLHYSMYKKAEDNIKHFNEFIKKLN